ncbi:MAG: hypothetical protein WCD86_17480 [Ktedonobacteraceae bacterium]
MQREQAASAIQQEASHATHIQLFGLSLLEPMMAVPAALAATSTTTDYTGWTYPDGGSNDAKTRDSYKDTDDDR